MTCTRPAIATSLMACLLWTPMPALAQDVAGPRNWNWGGADQRGAGNLITPESILDALSLVSEGEVIELSHEVAVGAPFMPGIQPEYALQMHLTSGPSAEMFAEQAGATNSLGVNLERIELTMHVGTHIDAIGHVSIGDTLYAGASGASSVTDAGLTHGGIETAPPFITRAILLDVAAFKGLARLEAGYGITPDDLAGTARAQGVQVTEGTIALVHTGSDDTFLNDPVAHATSSPGLTVDAARWLSSRGVIAVGGDNHALEVQPSEAEGWVFPVHQHFIVNQGIYIIENMKLDELAERRIYESTVIILPTKFRGATGAPVRIIALR